MVTQPLLPRHGLDEPLEDQPGIKDAIDQRREHAVDLAHARHEPALLAGAFLGVAVEAPACAPACLPDDPPLARQPRGVDRMLGGVHQDASGRQPAGDAPQ